MAIRKPIIKEQYKISIDDESVINALEKYIDEKIKQDPIIFDKKIIIDFYADMFDDNNRASNDFDYILTELSNRYEEVGWTVSININSRCMVLV